MYVSFYHVTIRPGISLWTSTSGAFPRSASWGVPLWVAAWSQPWLSAQTFRWSTRWPRKASSHPPQSFCLVGSRSLWRWCQRPSTPRSVPKAGVVNNFNLLLLTFSCEKYEWYVWGSNQLPSMVRKSFHLSLLKQVKQSFTNYSRRSLNFLKKIKKWKNEKR